MFIGFVSGVFAFRNLEENFPLCVISRKLPWVLARSGWHQLHAYESQKPYSYDMRARVLQNTVAGDVLYHCGILDLRLRVQWRRTRRFRRYLPLHMFVVTRGPRDSSYRRDYAMSPRFVVTFSYCYYYGSNMGTQTCQV